jgi:hypothetical protein
MNFRPASLAALCTLLSLARGEALELHPQRGSSFDLALTGRLARLPAGETRYVTWAELRALPTSALTLDGEFVKGPQVLTVVFLADLLKALPVEPGSDAVLATCVDGYASVYTSAFISAYRPFLVLEINGRGPGDWPPKGLDYNPGPYVVAVSPALAPAFTRYRDAEHKKPWGVTTLEIASYADRFGALYGGPWASLGPAARDGREIWVNSCASCHPGPAGAFGGTKAGRPFLVIAAYAGADPAFFSRYVRDPKSLVPCAQMEPHPWYTDAELSGLAAFVALGLK